MFYLDGGISLKIDNEEDFFISFDVALSLSTSSSIVIILKEIKDPEEVWKLHYTCSRSLITAKVKLNHLIVSMFTKKYFCL